MIMLILDKLSEVIYIYIYIYILKERVKLLIKVSGDGRHTA